MSQPLQVTDERLTYWAGPALMVAPEHAEPPVALLVLWRQRSGPPTGAVADRAGLLLDRGFARLSAPELDELRRLPRLSGGAVRLAADGRGLTIEDDARTLFTGELDALSEQWRDAVRAGGLILLADEAPQPDPPGTDTDLDQLALARMTTACAAGTLFGARIEVIQDGGPDPELDP